MYTGNTKNLGVIGDPILHSLSPVMHNQALLAANLDYVYIAMQVKSHVLTEAVNGLRSLNFRGFNVTIPHKTNILPLLDTLDEDAQAIGAVNTVVNDNGCLKGYNTDVFGFVSALEKHGFSIAGKKVVVLGAGGAARAVIWGLIKQHAARLTIGVRNPDKAADLVTYFRKYMDIRLFHWQQESFTAELVQADLLVNTTPLGMFPHGDAMPPVPWEQLNPAAFVYDIIYTPTKTLFLQKAAEYGHPILNGEEMLVGQGAAAFKLWTGQEPSAEVMLTALQTTLAKQQTQQK